MTMGYFRRADIPFFYALADAFTIGDAYYASIHGPTNPNRMYLFTGTSGLTVGDDGRQTVENADDGNWTGDAARDKADFPAARWTTYAERLQRAGVGWKVYQEYDNFGDNSLAYFAAFRGLSPDNELYRRGRAIVPGSTAANAAETTAQHLVDAFAADVAGGTLPSVSWLVAPTKYSEHPEAPPALGESLVSRVIDALTAHPEVWARTALIITYDENDGFFDHMPGPLPALTPSAGRSGVEVAGESYKGQPVGLGVRVPLIVVSPWTRGGWVNSQVFDHTSVLRFLERRFGVAEPNISPWRRAVAGDLTSMFDFADPDASALRALPSTQDAMARLARQARLPEPLPAIDGGMPTQEPARRPARALPYRLRVDEEAAPGLSLRFGNTGAAAAVFGVYDTLGTAGPWHYTVLPGTILSDTPFGLPQQGAYRLEIHGPNGFLRGLSGTIDQPPGLRASLVEKGDTIVLTLAHRGTAPARVTLTPAAHVGGREQTWLLPPGATRTVTYAVAANDHWYDVTVAVPSTGWTRRFAGHVETGRPSRSDPAIRTATPA
jgi:phospholipase C